MTNLHFIWKKEVRDQTELVIEGVAEYVLGSGQTLYFRVEITPLEAGWHIASSVGADGSFRRGLQTLSANTIIGAMDRGEDACSSFLSRMIYNLAQADIAIMQMNRGDKQ